MRIVIEGYESKRLEHASLTFSHRMQHFSHAMDITGLSLKRNFHEIAFRKALRELQQSAVEGNNLDVALGMLAVSELDDYRCGCKFDAICTMGRVRLGIVCHAETTMAPGRRPGEITEAQCPDSWAFRAFNRRFSAIFLRLLLLPARKPGAAFVPDQWPPGSARPHFHAQYRPPSRADKLLPEPPQTRDPGFAQSCLQRFPSGCRRYLLSPSRDCRLDSPTLPH